MTAEEYVKHYASGQGGYESVPVDIALRAIEYAKREAKQQMMAKAVDGLVVCNNFTHGYKDIVMEIPSFLNVDDKVKVIILKES